ncbi:MAG: SprA-related family protein [Desulfobacteraceae bacterium]|nr:MAG: SprA-related family protein [Desulfobacteraceae bacterium]
MNIAATANTPSIYSAAPLIYQTEEGKSAPGPANSPQETSGFSAGSDGSPPPDPSTDPSGDKQNRAIATPNDTSGLTDAEKQLLEQLKQADTEVRQHEMAHVAAGGALITSGANFTFKKGPDGNNYAVAGEVSIDTSEVPGDPEATLAKMRQVKTAALAPASPSPQDIKVASMATSKAVKAMSELMILQTKEKSRTDEAQAFGSIKQASDSYTRVQNLPEKDASTFAIAV